MPLIWRRSKTLKKLATLPVFFEVYKPWPEARGLAFDLNMLSATLARELGHHVHSGGTFLMSAWFLRMLLQLRPTTLN